MNYGRFDDPHREYVITRPDTPRPWANYLGNAEFGAVITNHAAGYTFYRSAAQGRLTRFLFNVGAGQLPGKYVYLRDVDSGDTWSPSWQPSPKPLDRFEYECRHGSGYSVIRSVYNRIITRTTYFVPMNERYEVWHVELTNQDDVPRALTAFPFIEPQCNWSAVDDGFNLQYNQYIATAKCEDGIIDLGSNVNMPTDPDHFENKDQQRHTFFALAGATPSGYDTDLTAFLGRYGRYDQPAAVAAGRCTQSECSGDMPCGAFALDLTLAPGETRQFSVLFGVGSAAEEGAAAVARMSDPAAVEQALAQVKHHWHSRLNALSATTPEPGFNSMVNMWSPYNNLISFYWSRAASLVYAGERDGLGYRDTVQDIVGACALVPAEARERLELMLTGQVANGGALPVVKPFSHRPGAEPLPPHYRADDSLWLFNAVPELVKETGDFDFYRRVLPFADEGSATVFEHLRRALVFSLERSGSHGLPCGLHADWNDCLRLGEQGESVFVAFQLRLGLSEYAEIARRLGDAEEEAWARRELATLDSTLEDVAWDGDWYLRAFRHDGLKFGSAENHEGAIFMNPQAWAVLSGHARGERAQHCMRALDQQLATEHGVMVCTPPFVSTDPEVCLARLFNPGMKENGGVFNHTQGWAIMAQAALGNHEAAWRYLDAVLPASYNDRADVREVEPYVVCQSTHSCFSPRHGAGRISWLSGAAVWNYYAMTHAILGIKPHYDGLEIDPCIPDAWDGFTAQRTFRGCQFNIQVRRGRTPGLFVNQERLPGALIPAEAFASSNTVERILP